MTTILVTGAAGYIGSAVCYKLLDRGYSVVAFDSLKYGTANAVPGDVRKFYQYDMYGHKEQFGKYQIPAIELPFRNHEIAAVVHLAAESLIPLSFSEPHLFYDVNVTGGLMLLRAMRVNGCQKLVFSSTSSVYHKDAEMPLTESSPVGPSSPYGASKLAFEQSLKWMKNLNWTAFRYFNVCGATKDVYERPYHRSRIIPVSIDTANGNLNDTMPLYGTDYPTPDGTCVRDYIHVDDIAEAHVCALESGETGVFNLGIGHGYSNRDVINAVGDVFGKAIAVSELPRRPGDPPTLVADPSKAKSVLKWKPKYTDLRGMVESCREFEPK
jgi:UDP-glucose 4-epimerase